jgi:hypothetical protein
MNSSTCNLGLSDSQWRSKECDLNDTINLEFHGLSPARLLSCCNKASTRQQGIQNRVGTLIMITQKTLVDLACELLLD